VSQTYPSRPVRTIVGQAAGNGSDIAARLLGQWLFERSQAFLVENRPGPTEISPPSIRSCWSSRRTRSNATLYDKLSFVLFAAAR